MARKAWPITSRSTSRTDSCPMSLPSQTARLTFPTFRLISTYCARTPSSQCMSPYPAFFSRNSFRHSGSRSLNMYSADLLGKNSARFGELFVNSSWSLLLILFLPQPDILDEMFLQLP